MRALLMLLLSLSFTLSAIGQNMPDSSKKLTHKDSAELVKAEEKCYDLYNRLKNNENDTTLFASLAIMYSNDTSYINFGRIKECGLENFGEPIKAVIKEMQIGEISKPVKTQKGYYIIKLNNKSANRYAIQMIFIHN